MGTCVPQTRHVLACTLGLGCIIPDVNIVVEPNRSNPGAVRIVQRISMSPEVNRACTAVSGFGDECPLPPPSQPLGLVDFSGDGQSFCVCPVGTPDGNALRQFDIFVEDPDLEADTSPLDDIFGAFLLDVPVDAEDPTDYLAYTNFLAPNEPAALFPIGRGSYNESIERPPINLKSWTVGLEGSVDLCNNDNGRRLEPGLHELRLIVTDRPWYLEVETDEEGKPVDRDGMPARVGTEPRFGVPDLPGGATYDMAVLVFRCFPTTHESCSCGVPDDF